MTDLQTDVLKSVSRSFYLTLRVLPGSVRPQVGLAYLLARATDTIADTTLVPVEERLRTLGRLRERILGGETQPLDLRRFLASTAQGSTAAERTLLERAEEVLSLMDSFAAEDRTRIRETLAIITSGQEMDLKRFELGRAGDLDRSAASGAAPAEQAAGSARPARPIACLETEEELDDYTYRVAGCVGEFWTRICRAHLFPTATVDEALLMTNGVRFGKGLQLVNILRDLPRDLRQGRCYLPAQQLASEGLAASDLLDPAAAARLRPLYEGWCGRAREHLRAGWSYTNALPRGCLRVRLACAWPILIGLETLAALQRRNPLDPAERVRVSRAAVRRIVTRSLIRSPFRDSWERLFDQSEAAAGEG
jgi:farnesyl-diphosphate farnesyltransferase